MGWPAPALAPGSSPISVFSVFPVFIVLFSSLFSFYVCPFSVIIMTANNDFAKKGKFILNEVLVISVQLLAFFTLARRSSSTSTEHSMNVEI